MRYVRRWASDVVTVLTVMALVMMLACELASLLADDYVKVTPAVVEDDKDVEEEDEDESVLYDQLGDKEARKLFNDAVISIATKMKGKDRTDILSALALKHAYDSTKTIDEIKVFLRHIESSEERNAAYRRIAFQTIESEAMWCLAPAIVRCMIEEDESQKSFVGSFTLYMLRNKEGWDEPIIDEVVEILEKVDNAYENQKQLFEIVIKLIEANEHITSARLISQITDPEFQDSARYKLLSSFASQNMIRSREGVYKASKIFIEQTIPLFVTPAKRAWGMAVSLKMFNKEDFDSWADKTVEVIKSTKDDESISVLLRMLSCVYCDNLDMKHTYAMLEESEKYAQLVTPLARRLELLTFIATRHGFSRHITEGKIYNDEHTFIPLDDEDVFHKKCYKLLREVKRSIDSADSPTLTNAQKIVLLQEVAEAKMMYSKKERIFSEQIEAINRATNEPDAVAIIIDILTRIMSFNYDRNPTKDPEKDRLQLPFEQYEREYFTPFKIPEDCGC
jgi:hypothetical protein